MYDFTYDKRPSPFIKMGAKYPSATAALASAFSVCHGNWQEFYAACRMARAMGIPEGLGMNLSLFTEGCMFEDWDTEDDADAERLQDLAHDYINGPDDN